MKSKSPEDLGASVKENLGGASAKKRRQKRIFVWGIGILLFSFAIMTEFSGMFATETEGGRETRRDRRNRRGDKPQKLLEPDRQKKRVTPQFATTDEVAVLEGELTLVDIYIPHQGLKETSSSYKYKAQAIYCNIDWKLQQSDPSTVPMFKDLRAQSRKCDGTLIKVDLFKVAKQARAYDANLLNTTTPTGVVFHETRCGSTLTANLLAGFSPDHARVYSESPPPVAALKACDVNSCTPKLHTQLIQDVFYLMGRTHHSNDLQYQFYKIQSIGVMAIDKFTKAFPNTPWVFLYRDSVEVMQSHLKGSNLKEINAVCTRNYKKKPQPVTTQQIMQSKDKTMAEISKLEYCAAHLAGLSLSAVQEHERTGKGRFVNYNQLPDILWDKVLPRDFGVPVGKEMIDNMQKIASVYSKGRGPKANQEWEEDSSKKLSTAPQQVIDAANDFLGDTFETMEALSHKNY